MSIFRGSRPRASSSNLREGGAIDVFNSGTA
jgi:hypothetical protein